MEVHDLIRSGRYKEALSWIDIQLTQKPKDAQLAYLKATVLYKLEHYVDAGALFSALYKQNPKSGKLLYSMALVSLAMGQDAEACLMLEHAYHNGVDEAIYRLIECLFTRKGFCDYTNCTDVCCKNVVLKGADAKPIRDNVAFAQLMANPQQNQGWEHKSTASSGDWVFDCHHLGRGNVCHVYDQRPQVCCDFPSSILALKSACSYTFELKPSPIRLQSRKCLVVVLDILNAYGYHQAMDALKALHARKE